MHADPLSREEKEVGHVAPGVTLAVIGAILAFAVRADPSGIDLRVVGVILMLAGAGLIWHARRGTVRERVVTRVEEPFPKAQDPRSPIEEHRVVREVMEERDHE